VEGTPSFGSAEIIDMTYSDLLVSVLKERGIELPDEIMNRILDKTSVESGFNSEKEISFPPGLPPEVGLNIMRRSFHRVLACLEANPKMADQTLHELDTELRKAQANN
jgi:hypothetical protein